VFYCSDVVAEGCLVTPVPMDLDVGRLVGKRQSHYVMKEDMIGEVAF
jgi:hypothetical protein